MVIDLFNLLGDYGIGLCNKILSHASHVTLFSPKSNQVAPETYMYIKHTVQDQVEYFDLLALA